MRVCTHCRMLLKQGEESCPRDSAPGRDVAFDVIPPILAGKLQQVEPFARGDTGSLYLAKAGRAAPQTVIKLLRAEVVEQVSERSRLKRELRKQTTLTNNSLCRIHDGGEEGAVLWLSRDYIEGESLAVKLKRERVIEPAEAYAIVAQVASALDELHRSGLLHRDVKPAHILLGAGTEGAPVATLIDACVPARLDAGGVFPLLGTPAYMAPEQGAGKPVSFRSDLYALGCVFYEMLCGTPPFSGPDAQAVLAQHMSAEPPEPTLELPPAARQLLQNLLSKDPRRRPFSAQQVRRVLEPFLPASTPRDQSGGTTSAGRLSAPLGAAGPETVGFPREDHTEEIQLEEVAVRPPRPQPFPSERPPEDLDAASIEALMVDEAMPMGGASAGETVEFVDFDAEQAAPAAEAPAPAPRVSGAIPPPPAASVPVAPRVQPARDQDLDSQVTRVFRPDQAMTVAAATGAGSRAPVPPPPTAAASPSRPPPPPPGVSSVPPMPPPRTASQGAAPVAPVPPVRTTLDSKPPLPDPEGTMMIRRPVYPLGGPMVWGAMAAAVVLVLVLVFTGDDDEEPAASAAATTETAEGEPGKTTAEPTPSAGEQAAKPASAAPAEQAEAEQAEPAKAEPAPAEPVKAEPEQAAPAPAPAAEPGAAPGTGAGTGTEPARAAGSDRDRGDPGAASRHDSTAPPKGSRADRAAQAEEYKTEGRKQFSAGRYDDASRAYEKATKLSPSDAGAFAGLGASRLQAKDYKGAIRAYERAVQLKPEVSGFQAALGKAYQEQGDRGRAIASYKRALKLNPTNTPAKNALKALGVTP